VTPLVPAPFASSPQLSPPTDYQGDPLICSLWACGTDCILDVCITDMDAKTYQAKDPMKVLLASHEKNRRRSILLFVLLCNAISPLSLCQLMAFLAVKLMLWFAS